MRSYFSEKINENEVESLEYNPYYPFIKDNNSISYVTKDRSGATVRKWLSSKFDIVETIFDEDKETIKYKLQIYTRFGINTVTIDKITFTNRHIEEISNYGINFDSTALNMLFKYVIASEQNAKVTRQYTYCGWENNRRFRGMDDNYVGHMDLSRLETSGRYMQYMNNFIKNSIGCQLMLSISFSSAISSLLEENLHTGTTIYHFFGDSSEGKTTGLQLAASVWGNPETGQGTFLSWNATDNAMLASLNGNHGIAVCFDESGAIRKRDYSNIIYCISQGIDRSRLNKDSQKRPSKQWNTVVLSSGENSLLDASSQNSGLRARVVEFMNLKITTDADHADHLKEFVHRNYGILGRNFVDAILLEGKDNIPVLHAKCQEHLLSSVNSDKSIVKRLISVLSFILIAAYLANKRMKLAIDCDAIADYLINHLKEIDRESLSLSSRAYDVIREWISDHQYSIQKLGESDFPGASAKMTKSNEIAIKSSVFQKLLNDNGFSDVKVVAQALRRDNLLHPEAPNGLQARIRFGNTKVQTYRIILKDKE